MDVILHIGAHRTASTSFQSFMRANARQLRGQAVDFWGPGRIRRGLLHGLPNRPESVAAANRAVGRVRLNLAKASRAGIAVLIVSDANLIGSPWRNLRSQGLYPDIGERMARIATGFDGPRRVVLQIRSLDSWWASNLACLVSRGAAIPGDEALDRISSSDRSWRHVISDLACACAETDILVAPFERFGSRPDRLFAEMTGALFPPRAGQMEYRESLRPRLPALRGVLAERGDNPDALPAGEGRWHPFDDVQAARLRDNYSDDLNWLRAGADGLARLTENPEPPKPAVQLVGGRDMRGHKDDGSARRLAPNR